MSNRACVKQRQDFCRSSVFISSFFCMYFYTTCDCNQISREQNRFFFPFGAYFIFLAGKRGEDQNHKWEYKIFGSADDCLLDRSYMALKILFFPSHQHGPEMTLKPKSTHPAKHRARNLQESITLNPNFKNTFIKCHWFSLRKKRGFTMTCTILLQSANSNKNIRYIFKLLSPPSLFSFSPKEKELPF